MATIGAAGVLVTRLLERRLAFWYLGVILLRHVQRSGSVTFMGESFCWNCFLVAPGFLKVHPCSGRSQSAEQLQTGYDRHDPLSSLLAILEAD